MPFGLTNYPAVFQAVVQDMLNKSVFIYLDDILIFSSTLDEHILQVQSVLQRLLENSLYVMAEKCEILIPTVSFLGFVVSDGPLKGICCHRLATSHHHMPATEIPWRRQLLLAVHQRVQYRSSSADSPHPKVLFLLSHAAEQAFVGLKNRCTTAAILIDQR